MRSEDTGSTGGEGRVGKRGAPRPLVNVLVPESGGGYTKESIS